MKVHLCQQVLGFPSQSVRELPAPRRQVEDGRGRHVGRLHVVGVVEAALTAGAAGTAPTSSSTSSLSTAATSSTAQAAAAARSVAAGRAAGRARRLTVALSCEDTHTTCRSGLSTSYFIIKTHLDCALPSLHTTHTIGMLLVSTGFQTEDLLLHI